MMSSIFILLAAAPLTLLFVALRGRGDAVGWWLGFGHGMLALLALAGVAAAGDRGFALFAALATVYAGAMCAAEAAHLMRRPARPA